MRTHGTTQCRPVEVFRTEEQHLLLPLPPLPFDVPRWSDPKVHRDFHCEVDRAIYSVPYVLVGRRLRARRDATTVKFYLRGELVKLHPRKAPGQRSTDPADMPPGKDVYARRDVERLKAMAAAHGDAIGTYAGAILDTRLPWTRMRQVYRLLGPGQEVGRRAGRAGLSHRPRRRGRRRQPRLADARAGPGGGAPTHAGTAAAAARPLRPRPVGVRAHHRGRPMSALAPSPSPELAP